MALAMPAITGHTIIVWILAIAALTLGERYVVDEAEPWLAALSGVLIVLLAIRMFWMLRRRNRNSHHHHGHDRFHGHQNDHGHSHEPLVVSGHVGTGEIVLFGFTGGLLPCPAAIAVLLICIQLQKHLLSGSQWSRRSVLAWPLPSSQ